MTAATAQTWSCLLRCQIDVLTEAVNGLYSLQGRLHFPNRSGGSVVARCGLFIVPDEDLHWVLTWILMRRLGVVESRSLKELNGPLNQHL